MSGVRNRLLGMMAATAVVVAFACPAHAEERDRENRESGAVGTFLEDWFGIGQAGRGQQPLSYYINPQAVGTGRLGPAGIDLSGAGRSDEGITLKLADSQGGDTLFTPRVRGFKLGLSIDPADNATRSPGAAALDMTQDLGDVHIGATLSFVDGQRGGFGGDGNTVGTALRIGFGGFVVGGGVRFADENGASAGWGFGASYALGDLSVSAGYIDQGDGSRIGDQTGLSISGTYQIQPGIAAQAAGFFGQGERQEAAERDTGVAVRGGIALEF